MSAKAPLSGGGTPGTSGTSGTEEVVYRGIRWRRSASGRTMWFNDGLRRWVLWEPGSDAPPMPGGWQPAQPPANLPVPTGLSPRVPGAGDLPVNRRGGAQGPGERGADNAGAGGRTDAMSRRAPMRSPFRIVPIVVVLLVVAAAAYQATRPLAKATKADVAVAESLRGHCLARDGGTSRAPQFLATPVNCSAGSASVKVVNVLVPGKPGNCPKSALLARVVDAALEGEPVECLMPVSRR